MSTVFDLVKAAGSIPLDELTVLSSASADSVQHEVDELERDGLVKVERPAESAHIVALTERGYRHALR
jgi:Mn-dependent DtxR family transcriptional regulator